MNDVKLIIEDEIEDARHTLERHPLLDLNANFYDRMSAILILKIASLQQGRLGKDMGLYDLAYRETQLERRIG